MVIEDINKFREESLALVSGASSLKELEGVRVSLTGAKSSLRQALKSIKTFPKEERAGRAKSLNDLQRELTEALDSRKESLSEAAVAQEIANQWQDLTLPGTWPKRGARHPVSIVEESCIAALRQLGFQRLDGPEVETSYFNFDALNIPEHHPARDLQDTFWLDEQHVLRTHTTSVQARILSEKRPLPIKVIASGRVYRNEAIDATHLAMFHQLEGFWIEEGLTFADLKGVCRHLIQAIYGEGRAIRFKPKYYPYTEPSLGIDVQCASCMGEGCSACHGAGWITVMGAGMVHPNVFKEFGHDPEQISGLAFGWGTTRLTTLQYGLDKLRPLYDGDVRLLRRLSGRM